MMVARFLELGGGEGLSIARTVIQLGKITFLFFFCRATGTCVNRKKIAEKWQSLCLEEARGG